MHELHNSGGSQMIGSSVVLTGPQLSTVNLAAPQSRPRSREETKPVAFDLPPAPFGDR